MKGLLIKDKTHWCDSWSAQMATCLEILDSTYNLLIFHERHTAEEILAQMDNAPEHIYQIIDIEKGHEDNCDIVSDAGTYYRISTSQQT
ncbi:hypothetical protein Pcar_1697 [Syntrophotalea carbinolica DSM 2380]|uniref:Uncharacterized protein n=1 Tax=Syntrophotalea carbinolica (strain DSM 2380 / NBRC 103641 / GraBd1) TaxID=338963 RepID=Q3A3W7_SYNC1|nr:hypothetical protein [Syntrophotalea carbinolica]ABA88940.1 hypothetical protein Pcar_1697 [Syntrophotalea carbinolica DSM 2380]